MNVIRCQICRDPWPPKINSGSEPFHFLLWEVFLDLPRLGSYFPCVFLIIVPNMLDDITPVTSPFFPLDFSMRTGTLWVFFTINIQALIYSRHSIIACWLDGWMSGDPALHQLHLCGCLLPAPPGIL